MTGFGAGVDISRLPHNVNHACHAMSYNERRSIFPLTRFAPGNPAIEEVWFLGTHSDVGGGYVKRGLADRSLEWMIEAANYYGLPIRNGDIPDDRADHAVSFNESLGLLTGFAGLLAKGRLSKEREALGNDMFHWSVQDERVQLADLKPRLPQENMIAYTARSRTPDTMLA